MSKKQPKLTPWFPSRIKPFREGVYQCNYDGDSVFRLYKDGVWHCYGHTVREAMQTNCESSNEAKWRGLAVKP